MARFPIGAFSVVAGLCSFALALGEVERVLGFAGLAATGIALLAVAGFLVVAGLYTAKALTSWASVRAEFADPVGVQFFPTLTISLLLAASLVGHYWPAAAPPLWFATATVHFLLMVVMAKRWILDTFRIGTFSPVWFLSVSGNLVAAMTGARLGFVELSWFFLSTGLLTCGAMFTISMYRLIFHDRVPVSLTPSLFLLLTPPSAAFLAYMRLGDGELDVLGRTLFFSALFVAAILVSCAPVLARARFSLGWWACTFPCAALTMAVLRYHQTLSTSWTLLLALLVLTLAVGLFLMTLVRTTVWLLRLLLPAAGDRLRRRTAQLRSAPLPGTSPRG